MLSSQPQRIRVRTDENAPFPLATGKTVHQRNKSTPALSTMYQTGTTKNNGPRRAAFGDVSNTTNSVQGSRDDAALAVKKSSKALEKPAALIVERKPSVLSQPAHRPLSTSGVKGVLNTVATQKPLEQSGKTVGLQQTANTRKHLIKRGTVFKDSLKPLTEKREIPSKETTELKEENIEGHLPASSSAPSQLDSLQEAIAPSKTSIEIVSNLPDNSETEEENEISKTEDDCQVQDVKERVKTQDPVHDHLPAPSEPEEYWDDEEDENEDEDGYNTATAYRSRGDNTTGGTTTVLFPKFTQKVKRELALAKQIVEATRTVEDIEDEFWDTSMVADYSDDIFEYMKEQEVRLRRTYNRV
jgi:hypothetical protein